MTDELESKITDEHREAIGRKSAPVTFTITEADATRLRNLMQDDDPRWAAGTGVAPPYVLGLSQGMARGGEMPRVLPGGIMTQQEWRFTRPFRIGEQLQAITQVIDLRDRLGGRYGYSVLITSSTDFYDAGGEHVAASLISITQFDPKAARER
ncbi:MAG: FAS1-like dehydratase domain-containing protein [Dehalococcoidia bacterium]